MFTGYIIYRFAGVYEGRASTACKGGRGPVTISYRSSFRMILNTGHWQSIDDFVKYLGPGVALFSLSIKRLTGLRYPQFLSRPNDAAAFCGYCLVVWGGWWQTRMGEELGDRWRVAGVGIFLCCDSRPSAFEMTISRIQRTLRHCHWHGLLERKLCFCLQWSQYVRWWNSLKRDCQ